MKIIATLLITAASTLVIGSGIAKADTCYTNCFDTGQGVQCQTTCY